MASSRNEGASSKNEELKVFISHRSSVCGECHEELGSRARKRYERQGLLVIAEHACEKYSGRVGRSAAARRLVTVHLTRRETGA